MRDDASETSYSSWGGEEGNADNSGTVGGGGGAGRGPGRADHLHGGSGAAELSRQLNNQISQASTLQELIHVVVVNYNRLNAVNLCTAYHRIARHVQDTRNPLERWPPQQVQQLGGLLSRLNHSLAPLVDQVQAQNLGITLWSMSKVFRVQQAHAPELIDALQREVVNRLHNITQQAYMTNKHYKFGPQSLSNIIYSAATMNLKVDYDMLHMVGKAIGWQIEEFKPQGLANTVWSLGKLGTKLTYEVRQLVDVCCKEMYNQLAHQRYKGNYAPQNISNALHGLAKLGYVPNEELLAELAKCAGTQLRHFGPQEITNMVWGFASLYRIGATLPNEVQALVDRIADELSLYFQDRQWRTKVKPQTISNMIWAYASLKRCPQKLNQDLIREMLAILPQFKPQEMSNVLWALATMAHYPGATFIDTVVQATCAVVSDMKPQEVSNTVWALATLRHFPGAQALDTYIQHAYNMLDRFKSQEIGNLMWALARLGYMPAAGFALAIMPYIQQWKQTDVQDCGNLLWAFMILDVLTTGAMELLGERLSAMPREQFTQESYIQIYQAKMALSQKVATIAQYIPSDLLRQAELEWRQQSFHNRISKTHREVAETLTQLQEPHELERRIEDGLLSVDLALIDRMVAVEVDGSSHFSANEPFVPLGKSVLRWRMLSSRGWKVVTVPYYRWAVLRTMDERKEYLWRLLQCDSVWACLSVDPNDRDAPPNLPINMAYITPDDVMAHMAKGAVLPSFPPELIPHSNSSPVSTLLGAAPRPGSSHSTPTAGGLGYPPQGGPPGGSLSAGPPPLLPPRHGPGSALSPQTAPFGSPFSNQGRTVTVGAAGGGGASRLGRPGSTSFGQQGQQAQQGGVGGGVALPDSLYGSSGSDRADSMGPPPPPPQPSLRPSGSGLSVTAKPFTLGSSTFSASAAAWEPSGEGMGSAGGGGGGGSGQVPRPPSSLLPSPSAPHHLMAGGPSPSAGAGGAYGGMAPAPSAPAGAMSRTAFGSGILGGMGGHSGRSTPVAPNAFVTPTQSPTAAGMVGLSGLPYSAGLPPGSAQSVSTVGAKESDDDIDDLRGFFAQVAGVSSANPTRPAEGRQTVEAVRDRILALSSDRPISDIQPWLADWDAPLLCALLRTMTEKCLSGRAVQLFDWIRNLPTNHALSSLCCPSSYAAMMELYGGWQQPGRATRLLGDAKARGMDMNAELYGTLLQQMCRCERYDIASDIFKLMLEKDMEMDSSVLLAMMGAHLERCQWGDVLDLLDLVRSYDTPVEPEVFNLVMSKASQAGERELVIRAFKTMCDHGVTPTPATWNTLMDLMISEHPSQENAADALLNLIDKAPLDGPEQIQASLLALLSACANSGAWQLARQVLENAPGHGLSPSLAACNTAMSACAARGAAEGAQSLFDSLGERGLGPDAASYSALIKAYHAAGQWVKAAAVFEAMQEAGHGPSSELYSHVIGALWESGTPWGQAKAVLLFQAANRAHALVPPSVLSNKGIVKVDLNAVDVGTGTLVLHNWIVELRNSIGNSNTSGLLDDHRRLVVNNGSSASTPQGLIASKLKGELGSSLVTHKSPFRLTAESGRASRLEASTQMVKRWLFNESFMVWTGMFSGEAALQGSGMTLDDLPSAREWEPQEAQLRAECTRMFGLVRSYEAKHSLAYSSISEQYKERRKEVQHMLVHLTHEVLQLGFAGAQSVHAAAVLLDRLGAQGYQPQSEQVLAAAAVAVAVEREGFPVNNAALVDWLNYDDVLAATGFEPAAALDAERGHVDAVLGGDPSCISSIHCWKVYADRLGVATDNLEQMKAVLGDSYYTLSSVLWEDFSLKYPPSVQAAAVVYISRKRAGVLPFWPAPLQELTGYDERSHALFADAIAEFEKPVSYGPVVTAAVFS